MTLRIPVLAAAAGAAALAMATAAPAATPKVNGTVGPSFTIGITQNGKKVTSLKAGKVTFVVADKSSIHNFEISGPKGFAKKLTDVGFTGTKTVTLTLPAGSYTFFCKPHKSSMKGTFKVS